MTKDRLIAIILKLFGLGIMLCDAAHFFGLYEFPNPTALNKPMEVAIAFLVGLILLVVDYSSIKSLLTKGTEKAENKAEDLLDKK